MKRCLISHEELTTLANVIGQLPWIKADAAMTIIKQAAKRQVEIPETESAPVDPPSWSGSGLPEPVRKA